MHGGAGTFISVMSRECVSTGIGTDPELCGIICGSMAGFGFMIRATAQGLLLGMTRSAVASGPPDFRITGRLGNNSLYWEPSNWNGFGATGDGTRGAVWAQIEAQPEAIKIARQSNRVKVMGTSLSKSGLYLKIMLVDHA